MSPPNGERCTQQASLYLETVRANGLEQIAALLGQQKPHLLAVQAFEAEGMNVIPRVLAETVASKLGLRLAESIVQINRVSHTGSSGYQRLAYPALFGGTVEPGEYFLVDDFIGQGGTLANLRGFIETHGGRVIGACDFTQKMASSGSKRWRVLHGESTTCEAILRPG